MSLLDPPVILPALGQCYLSSSSGAVTFSGGTLTVPALQAVIGRKVRDSAEQTLTPDVPTLTCATVAAGVPTLTQDPQHLALLNIAVTNASGGSVTGGFNIEGNDERGIYLFDTISITALANGASTNIQSNKYFAEITAINTFTGNANAAGVSMVITEKQFRGHLKVDVDGVVGFAWDNTLASGEQKICTFEVVAAGVLSVKDKRLLGPIPASNRRGVIDFSGGSTNEGPPSWGGQCIYCACEGMDGHLFISGNGAQVSEFDGDKFVSTWTPTGLGLTDHVLSMYNMGLVSSKEIIYFATSTGIVIRWNRTDNSYSTVTTGWNATFQISKIVKGTSNNKCWLLGGGGQVFELTDNGGSRSVVSYTQTTLNAGSTAYDGVWFDAHLYIGGGGAVWMSFHRFNQEANKGLDLSTFLPGTSAQQGRSLSALVPKIFAMGVNPTGKMLIAAQGNGFYLAEWDTRQQFATGKLTFTATGASTIPAGFTVSNGTVEFTTLQACATSGAGTVTVPAIASNPGDLGLVAAATVTTLVSAAANVSAVTNPTPFGMGRLIAPAGNEDVPSGLISGIPLGVLWTGSLWLVFMQGGDVLSFDGQRLRTITSLFDFKGRATFGLRTMTGKCWAGGDEGKLYAIPT